MKKNEDSACDENLRSMTDEDLKNAWLEEFGHEGSRRFESEMALRWIQELRRKQDVQSQDYFTAKFLRMPEDFKEAYYQKDWYRAKCIYDRAIYIGLFMEIPERIRNHVFGSRQDERNPVNGLFNEHMVNKVMKECLINNRLGHECMVYRIPGEAGFYGAKAWPGTRYMPAEENPAFHAV